jgi:hypothetical protein
MLQQVAGSVFTLMTEYQRVWRHASGSDPVDLFGFRYDVGLDPIPVNVGRMVEAFRRGYQELAEIWEIALSADTLQYVHELFFGCTADGNAFHVDDKLWVRMIYDFAAAHHRRPVDRSHMLRSLAPLYMARVASFVNETRDMNADEVENRIEQLCLCFEAEKSYLLSRWSNDTVAPSTKHAAPRIPVEV